MFDIHQYKLSKTPLHFHYLYWWDSAGKGRGEFGGGVKITMKWKYNWVHIIEKEKKSVEQGLGSIHLSIHCWLEFKMWALLSKGTAIDCLQSIVEGWASSKLNNWRSLANVTREKLFSLEDQVMTFWWNKGKYNMHGQTVHNTMHLQNTVNFNFTLTSRQVLLFDEACLPKKYSWLV